MSDMTIEVHPRSEAGKNVNRRLRSEGLVPAVVYGAGRDTLPIQLQKRSLLELIKSTQGHNPVFLLKLAGTDKSRHAMIRDLQIDPVSRQVLHVDFQRVLMTEAIKVQVDIELKGTPTGVKVDGGILDFMTREVEIECLPDKIPASLELDVSDLQIGDHLEAQHLQMPEGVTLMDEGDKVIVSVSHARVVEEPVEEEDEGLIEAEADEPEVIAKGKGEDEEAD